MGWSVGVANRFAVVVGMTWHSASGVGVVRWMSSGWA